MSHFLFGTIISESDWDSEKGDADSRRILQLALSIDINSFLGYAIPQDVVWRMLDNPRRINGSRLPFLLSTSPIRDTSDEMINPLQDLDNGLETVASYLRRVQSWVESILSIDHIHTVEMRMTEGYDSAPALMEVDLKSLALELTRHISWSYVDSIYLSIKKYPAASRSASSPTTTRTSLPTFGLSLNRLRQHWLNYPARTQTILQHGEL